MTSYSLAVVMVNYHTENLVTALIENIIESVAEVVVVDNVENNGLGDQLPETVVYVDSPTNTGYAGGNNAGIDALGEDIEYALVLNPDTTISPSSIEALIEAVQRNDDLGVVGPTVVDLDTGEVAESEDIRERVLRATGQLPSLPEDDEGLSFQSSIHGCAMLVDLDVHRSIDGFDERFFLYQEETDYCYRSQKAGYDVAICEAATVGHDMKHEDFPKDVDYQLYYYLRNGFLLSQTSFEGVGTIQFLCFHVLSFVTKFLSIVRSGRSDLLFPFLFALIDGIRGKFGQRRYP